ncbi:MAG TPA: hypothetical protein VMT52_17405 [Planctomycetota bacterium]|nr:hypothetical protein [Planctomycetota bacterium]
MRHLGGYVRLFESALHLLARRGHRIHLSADYDDSQGGWQFAEGLAKLYPGLTFERTPSLDGDKWIELGKAIRGARDHLRYFDPMYDSTPKLRARGAERAPRLVVRLSRLPLVRSRAGIRLLGAMLRSMERALPASPVLTELLRAQDPDVVLLTPLLDLGSPQPEYLRCARALGLRTALCVGSWDHLSSKALIRDVPDLVTVWNETQKDEAEKLHGVPPAKVAVTGAQSFDQWFGWTPRPREEFCRSVGLDPGRPYVLYVVSSLFEAKISEPEFVERWIRQVRGSGDARLREAGILVRPHPKRMQEWRKVDLSSFENVAVSFPGVVGAEGSTAQADYFDSLHHSAAVVGINTSALIEAGIVGRPVYTILAPEFSESQEGTIHFRYLLDASSGLLHVARSFEEHLGQLGEALAGRGLDPARGREFVQRFIRPHGLDVAAAPIFVDRIEELAASSRPAPRRARPWHFPLRAILYLSAVWAKLAAERRLRNLEAGKAARSRRAGKERIKA